MCGPTTSNRPRGGALATLNTPSSSQNPPLNPFRGDIYFHTPGDPSSTNATYISFRPESRQLHRQPSNLHLIIHQYGDLTKPASESGLFSRLELTRDDMLLEQPLELGVSASGIIGRRVSLCYGDVAGEAVLAEGIVGFNFLNAQGGQSDSGASSPSSML